MKKALVLTLLCTVAAPFAWASSLDTAAPETTQAVETKTLVAPLPTFTVSDDWKTCELTIGQKLGMQTQAPIDKTLQPFFDRMNKALTQAVLDPNAEVNVQTPELDVLITNMRSSSKRFEASETQAVLKDADVSSLSDTRALLVTLLEQYELMKKAVVPHLVWACEAARALHKAIEHEQGKIDTSKETLKAMLPAEVVTQTQEFIAQAEADIARLKNTLLCIVGVGRALYPEAPPEATLLGSMASWLPSSPFSSESVLKKITGVDSIPASIELIVPESEKDRAYYEFLQKMLGHASWVKDQAFEKGRLKWIVDAPKATEPSTEEAAKDATAPTTTELPPVVEPQIGDAGDDASKVVAPETSEPTAVGQPDNAATIEHSIVHKLDKSALQGSAPQAAESNEEPIVMTDPQLEMAGGSALPEKGRESPINRKGEDTPSDLVPTSADDEATVSNTVEGRKKKGKGRKK